MCNCANLDFTLSASLLIFILFFFFFFSFFPISPAQFLPSSPLLDLRDSQFPPFAIISNRAVIPANHKVCPTEKQVLTQRSSTFHLQHAVRIEKNTPEDTEHFHSFIRGTPTCVFAAPLLSPPPLSLLGQGSHRILLTWASRFLISPPPLLQYMMAIPRGGIDSLVEHD